MTLQFPPLLNSHEMAADQNPAFVGLSGANDGRYSAGDVLWVRNHDTLDFAIVLEPDVDRLRSLEMIFVLMVALGDAIGAIAPPEVAITHYWPNTLLANDAEIGAVHAHLSESDGADGCPLFMVVAAKIAVRPKMDDMNPGLDENRTTLWDEGCGDLDAMQLLEATARHFMTWVHTWQEEGFQPVLTLLDSRMVEGHAVSLPSLKGTYLGLDESANMLVSHDGGSRLIKVSEVVNA